MINKTQYEEKEVISHKIYITKEVGGFGRKGKIAPASKQGIDLMHLLFLPLPCKSHLQHIPDDPFRAGPPWRPSETMSR